MAADQSQYCPRCGSDLALAAFPPSKRGVKGAWCSKCLSDYNLDRYHGLAPRSSVGSARGRVCALPGCAGSMTHRAGQAKYCSLQCKDAAFYARNRHRRFWRPGQARRKYGVDIEATVEAQGGKCANPTCDRAAEQVDHCHATGTVRGVLCRQCNTALGMVADSVAVLRGLISYLADPPGGVPA